MVEPDFFLSSEGVIPLFSAGTTRARSLECGACEGSYRGTSLFLTEGATSANIESEYYLYNLDNLLALYRSLQQAVIEDLRVYAYGASSKGQGYYVYFYAD